MTGGDPLAGGGKVFGDKFKPARVLREPRLPPPKSAEDTARVRSSELKHTESEGQHT